MTNDQLRFELCDVCLPKYQQLSYDPACEFRVSIIPLCSIYWLDEHPENGDWLGVINRRDDKHVVCRKSIFKLLNARDSLWRKESVPMNLATLWNDARNILPDWPGFQRLTIGQEEASCIVAAHMDLAEGLSSCEEGTVEFTETDAGVALRIKAQGQSKPSKKWWQFWR